MQSRGAFLTSPRGSSRSSVDQHATTERDDIEVQIILRGDVDVGKKTLMRSFMSSEIAAEAGFIHSAWSSKRCTIDGQTYRVRVGLEHLGVTDPQPITDPNFCGHMLCFDVTNQRSFDSVMHLAGFRVQTLGDSKLRRSSLGSTSSLLSLSSKSSTSLVSPLPSLAALPPVSVRPLSEPSMILVATKADQTKQRNVTYEGAKKDAISIGLEYVETSARESFGVDIAFILLLCNIHERLRRVPDFATHKVETGTVSKLFSSLTMTNKRRDAVVVPAPTLTAGLGSRLVSDAIREELEFQAYQSWLIDGSLRSLRLGQMNPAALDTVLRSPFKALHSESPPALAIPAVLNAGYLLHRNSILRILALDTITGKGSPPAVWNADCAHAVSFSTNLTTLTLRGYDLSSSSFWTASLAPTHLTSLNLTACNLQPDSVLRLAVTLRHSALLQQLNLSRNPMKSTAAVARLVVLLRGVLKSLDLSECAIATEEDVRPLAQALCHSLVRTVCLVKNPLEIDAAISLFSCAPAFIALSTLLLDPLRVDPSLQSAHELWLALQANTTLTDVGPFLREMTGHRLSEATSYLDRNKGMLAKANRGVPRLVDLAAWELRKDALVFRPQAVLTSYVLRKVPAHVSPPLRRLVECALPPTEQLEAWCADSRSPALFPSGLVLTYAPLAHLLAKHNRHRIERNIAYRQFLEMYSKMPVSGALVLIDMAGRDIDVAHRIIRKLYPNLNPNPISSPGAPLLTPISTPSGGKSPRRALTYYNSSPRSESQAVEEGEEEKLVEKSNTVQLVYFMPTSKRLDDSDGKKDNKTKRLERKKEKKGEEGMLSSPPLSNGEHAPAPAQRLKYFPPKTASTDAVRRSAEVHKGRGLSYFPGKTAASAPLHDEEKKNPTTIDDKGKEGTGHHAARMLAYFPPKVTTDTHITAAAEEKKYAPEEDPKGNSVQYFSPAPAQSSPPAPAPTSGPKDLSYFPDKVEPATSAAAGASDITTTTVCKAETTPVHKGLLYFPAKAAEEKETPAVPTPAEVKPAAKGLSYFPAKIEGHIPTPPSPLATPSPPGSGQNISQGLAYPGPTVGKPAAKGLSYFPHKTDDKKDAPVACIAATPVPETKPAGKGLSYFPIKTEERKGVAAPVTSPSTKDSIAPPILVSNERAESAVKPDMVGATALPVGSPATPTRPKSEDERQESVGDRRGTPSFVPHFSAEKREERKGLRNRSLSGQYRMQVSKDTVHQPQEGSLIMSRGSSGSVGGEKETIASSDSGSPGSGGLARARTGLTYYTGDSKELKEEKRQASEQLVASVRREREREKEMKERMEQQERLEQLRMQKSNSLRDSPNALVPVSLPPMDLPLMSPKTLQKHRSLAYFPGSSPENSPHVSQTIVTRPASPPRPVSPREFHSITLKSSATAPALTSGDLSSAMPARLSLSTDPASPSAQRSNQANNKSPRRTLSYFPSGTPKQI